MAGLNDPARGVLYVYTVTERMDNSSVDAVWMRSDRCDPLALPMADRHYNRQKIGSPQFVPPGRCLVLRREDALWVTSYPFAEYVRHAWAGAWVNSLFRNEGDTQASDLIRLAVAHTRAEWETPELGMITFVDPKHVKPTVRRGQQIFGYCYLKAGFKHVGFTKGGLWAWQLLPREMPDAKRLSDYQEQFTLFNDKGEADGNDDKTQPSRAFPHLRLSELGESHACQCD